MVRTDEGRCQRQFAHLEATGCKYDAKIAGNRGVPTLPRIDGDSAIFLLITPWDSQDAIKRFDGDHPETAVHCPDDEAFLLGKEPHVIRYGVVERDGRSRTTRRAQSE